MLEVSVNKKGAEHAFKNIPAITVRGSRSDT